MKITLIPLVLLLWSTSVYGQTIEPSNFISHANYHQNAQGASLYASFCEVATEFMSEGDVSISQGFLQTYLQLVPVENTLFPDLKIKIGPIPCTTYLTIEKSVDKELIADILNTNGQVISTRILLHTQNHIEVSNLPAGTYFIRIKDGETPVFETFKFIKS